MRRRLLAAGFAVVIGGAMILTASAAHAATINVPGNNGKSIQDGVDLANPGDTVRIAPKKKSYIENVVVATNRVSLVGVTKKGKRPVIDGAGADGVTPGLTLDIDANNVKVRNIGSRHGQGIDCTGDGCGFDRVAVSQSDQGGDCIVITGNGGSVKNSNLLGCDSEAIEITGNGARVIKNSVRQSDSGCVEIDGNGLLLANNRIQNCEDDVGFSLDGDEGTIRDNIVRNTDSQSFDVSGDRNRLEDNVGRNVEADNNFEIDGNGNVLLRNRAIHAAGDLCFEIDGINVRLKKNRAQFCDGGYEIDGENMKVTGNRIADNGSGDEGFDISCSDEAGGADPGAACERAVVANNLATDAGDDDEGFEIGDDDEGGMTIRANRSENNNDGGFEIDVAEALIADNSSRFDGAEGNEPGFEIDGDDNRIEGNRTFATGDDGLNVFGAGNRIIGNLTRRSNIDGIGVDAGSTDTLLRANQALGNFGDGIENDGDATDLVKNRASGNRVDCVNDGTVDLKQGNKCADGSNFNEPGTVDRPAHRRH